MTEEEICDFWKLGAFLQRVPKDSNDPQVLDAMMHYKYLKDKMLSEIASQKETAEEKEIKMDARTAICSLDATITTLAAIVNKMVPQIASNQSINEMLDTAKLAIGWLNKNIDSLTVSDKHDNC